MFNSDDDDANTEAQNKPSAPTQCAARWFELTYAQTLPDVERMLQSSGGLGASRPLR